ncbi:hypothetical protein H0H92_011190 [Tricholoma furcatifolium]|nr:hypothetical protein H0H92_011190 [Tricholoma furcatifolium]
MASYAFTHKDFLNSTLRPLTSSSASAPAPYRISTNSGFLAGNKVTTLDPYTPSGVSGKIHWKSDEFEIGRVRRATGTLIYSTGGFWNLGWTQECRWSYQSYVIQYANNQWTVTPSNAPRSIPVAILVPYESHIFRSAEPATLSLAPGLPNEEGVFLMLVLLYSEVKRLQHNQAASNAAMTSAISAS